MLKKIGRLDMDDIAEIVQIVDKLAKDLVKDKAKAEKDLNNISKTPNYFVREELGKQLAGLTDQRKLLGIAQKMLVHKFYGVRATALFYFFNKYNSEPGKILEVLEKTYETVPWESESIINFMWKRYAKVMKVKMLEWIVAENDKQRAISFHGMENIAGNDPDYIMDFIGRVIDDESMEVQKKITHILTQVARSKPGECYPYIREWLATANDRRMKTLWVSMKKLANIVIQKSRRDKSQEFMMLTHQTISDWKRDSNANVASMGKKLAGIVQTKN